MMNQCYFFQIIKIFDMKKYKILGLTLARGGSQGIKNKNIKLLKGKPLIYYTIIEALKSKLIDRYVVSTDSKIFLLSMELNHHFCGQKTCHHQRQLLLAL